MAHILIATDFSENAMHAAEYAVKLFGPRGHTYTLLHTYFDLTTAHPMMPTSTGQLMMASEEGLREFADRFINKTGVERVEQEVAYGGLPGTVNDLARNKGVELVVVGNRGRTGKALFGSNTVSMIKASRIPVLAVPEAAMLKRAERILLADDYEDILPRHLKMLRLIASINQSEVLVAHVPMTAVEPAAAWNDDSYGLSLEGIPHSFHEAAGYDVVHGLDRFARQKHVDMITVLHRHIGLIGRLLHPSTVRDLARHSDLPLLVLEDAD